MDDSVQTLRCHILNQTHSITAGVCPKNLHNACFLVWELPNEVENKNLTEIINNSVVIIKGCWEGHYIEKDYCDYNRNQSQRLICYCKSNNCNAYNQPYEHLISSIRFNDNHVSAPSNQLTQSDQSHLFIYIFPIILLLCLTSLFFYKQRDVLKKKFLSLISSINQSYNPRKQNQSNVKETQEPLLLKSTPKIIELIRQGQYGNVYRGKLERTNSTEQLQCIHPGQQQQAMDDFEKIVAIKAYSQNMYDSFKHEYNVYNLPNIKHPNILKFISHLEKHTSPSTLEYWLVLEYHENGSLYDYLKRNLVSNTQLLDICLDIATGLAHLHNSNNYVLVHRDIKSKNILLKIDLSACISDFNLALILYPNQPASENLDQVGTVRYMSPEVLDCAIQFSKEGLLKIDIYSTSLVFWEVLSRCSAQLGPVEPYTMPYEKELGVYLNKEKLRKHVSDNNQRPKIPDHWCDHSDLKEFVKTIKESWDKDSDARLTASGIVERLKRIKRKEF